MLRAIYSVWLGSLLIHRIGITFVSNNDLCLPSKTEVSSGTETCRTGLSLSTDFGLLDQLMDPISNYPKGCRLLDFGE